MAKRFIFLRKLLSEWHLLLIGLVISVIMVGPFIWTLLMSFRFTNEILASPYSLPIPFHLDNYVRAFTDYGFLKYIINSVIVVILSLIITTAASTLAAYGFARKRFEFKFREIIFYFLFLSIMFPPQIFLLSLFQLLVNYKLYNNLMGLVLVYSALGLPLTIFILRSFFSQIPGSLEDSAYIDGCNSSQVFWKIMFPIAMPAVSTVIILNLITFWNEFLFAVTFITKQALRTLPLAVMFFLGESHIDLGLLASGVIVSSLPIILLYVAMSEKFIRGMTAGAVKY